MTNEALRSTLQAVAAAAAVIAYLGAAALQTRARRRWLRVVGRILTLGPFAVVTLFFVGMLATVYGNSGGGFEDLALVIVMIPFFLMLFPALYPLASILLRPRVAWIVPAAVAVVSFAAVLLGLDAFRGGSSGNPLAFGVAAGAVALSGVLTWAACFLGNPRCRPEREAAPPADPS